MSHILRKKYTLKQKIDSPVKSLLFNPSGKKFIGINETNITIWGLDIELKKEYVVPEINSDIILFAKWLNNDEIIYVSNNSIKIVSKNENMYILKFRINLDKIVTCLEIIHNESIIVGFEDGEIKIVDSKPAIQPITNIISCQ